MNMDQTGSDIITHCEQNDSQASEKLPSLAVGIYCYNVFYIGIRLNSQSVISIFT